MPEVQHFQWWKMGWKGTQGTDMVGLAQGTKGLGLSSKIRVQCRGQPRSLKNWMVISPKTALPS